MPALDIGEDCREEARWPHEIASSQALQVCVLRLACPTCFAGGAVKCRCFAGDLPDAVVTCVVVANCVVMKLETSVEIWVETMVVAEEWSARIRGKMRKAGVGRGRSKR